MAALGFRLIANVPRPDAALVEGFVAPQPVTSVTPWGVRQRWMLDQAGEPGRRLLRCGLHRQDATGRQSGRLEGAGAGPAG